MQKTSHAIFNRIYVRAGLVAALVGGLPLISHAAYANLAPPPGWTAGGGAIVSGPGGAYSPQTLANKWIGNAAKTSAMLNVGGRQVAVNATLKLAPNAGRVAAAALFAMPQLRTAAAIAAWIGVANVVWDISDQHWSVSDPEAKPSTGYDYSFTDGGFQWHPDSATACGYRVDQLNAMFNSQRFSVLRADGPSCTVMDNVTHSAANIGGSLKPGTCPVGWFVTPAGCVQKAPLKRLTEKEMVDLLNPDNTPGWPNPDTPNAFPGIAFPTELPILNPDTGVNPFPKPLYIPTGEPVKNPQYDPSKPASKDNPPYKQPGVRATPKPTTKEPWRVDIEPVDRPVVDPNAPPDPEQGPGDNPDASPDDKPRQEDQQSLCEKHPDILACAKPELDTPEGEIPKSTREVTFTEENLFGSGGCPADVYFAPGGLQQFKLWDWNKACGDITTYVKPVVLLLAAFSCIMILSPGRTE